MDKVEISRGVTYSIVSYGNGWAYSLHRRPRVESPLDDSPSIWFQDEDALYFESEREALERVHGDWTADRIMQELWSLYDGDNRAEVA